MKAIKRFSEATGTTMFAEWEQELASPIVHRTQAGAEAALAAMAIDFPEGQTPWVYAGLRIEDIQPHFSYYVVD